MVVQPGLHGMPLVCVPIPSNHRVTHDSLHVCTGRCQSHQLQLHAQGHRGSVMVACTSQVFAVMCCCCIVRLCLTLVNGQLRRLVKAPMARACSLLNVAFSLLEVACCPEWATLSVQPLDVAWICKLDIIEEAASPCCSASWLPTGLLSCGIAPVPPSCWRSPDPSSASCVCGTHAASSAHSTFGQG